MSGFHILPDPNKFRLEPGVVDEGPSIFYPKYGLLYNWYAANDARNICAAGWHVPTNNELIALREYLDPLGVYNNNIAGGKLKETGLLYWLTPNTGATNEIGFNGRGSSSRGYLVWGNLGAKCYLWSSTEHTITNAYIGILSNDDENFYTSSLYVALTSQKYNGMSIRPLKDSTTLTHGQTGIYQGNDSKIYPTICINGVEYLSTNLCETEYRNGDPIPEVTDNAAWIALTSGALCAYNNDWANV